MFVSDKEFLDLRTHLKRALETTEAESACQSLLAASNIFSKYLAEDGKEAKLLTDILEKDLEGTLIKRLQIKKEI